MTKKLLVITAGTVAASVGQELIKQMKAHPNSALQVMVRYIDTAYLPNRYASLRNGEWFQMNIGQRYMDALYKRIDEYPRIKSMLFPGLLPGTAVTGGGSIRYNGAGAVEVQRDHLQRWLSASMAELAQSGNSDTNISMALIISAVGATGSGSLEHLIEVIVDAAYHAKIKSTNQSNIRCDVYILQPGRNDVTELGLANTLALYAELASSQLSLRQSTGRQYQGRKIMVDWGSTLALSSMDQLIEATATLVRLSSDATSSFSSEFQEREVDNHVLRELDPISNLPMHLSTTTVVTISLGNLVEQVIQRDAARLIDSLVFGKSGRGTTNIFLGKISQALAGETGAARYRKLVEHLSGESIRKRLASLDRIAADQDTLLRERVIRLQSVYQETRSEVSQSNQRIQNEGRTFLDATIREMERTKQEQISTSGISLTELREEYAALERTVKSTLDEALSDVQTTRVNDDAINTQLRELQGSGLRNRVGQREKLQRLVALMKRNLQGRLIEVARDSALDVLEGLQTYSARAKLNLDVVLERLGKQRANQEGWAAAYRDFSVETGHPLYLTALFTREEVQEYADKISIFSTRTGTRANAAGTDQIVGFRQWLVGNTELFESLFEGDVDRLTTTALSYTSQKVLEEVSEKRKVIDVLLESKKGEGVLVQRLKDAAAKAVSLVSYDPDFAPERREVWHVSADFGNSQVKRDKIQKAMDEAIKGQSKLLPSSDPTEIAVYYYVDGIPMSAVDDLKGRCLKAFLNRRKQWLRQQASLNSNGPVSSLGSFNQRVGVPVYSGRDAEERVRETGVIRRLYEVKGNEVGEFSEQDIPELGLYPPANQQGASTNMNGHIQVDNRSTTTTQPDPTSSTQKGNLPAPPMQQSNNVDMNGNIQTANTIQPDPLTTMQGGNSPVQPSAPTQGNPSAQPSSPPIQPDGGSATGQGTHDTQSNQPGGA